MGRGSQSVHVDWLARDQDFVKGSTTRHPGGVNQHLRAAGARSQEKRRAVSLARAVDELAGGDRRVSDGTFRIVAKAIDPKTGKPKFKERFTREMDPQTTQNAAIAYRTELINEIKIGTTGSGVPTEIPRLETLCRSSWITFVTENVASESRAAKLGRVVETHILRRWGEHFIDQITVPEIDAWVRSLTADYGPETIRHHVGLFRRIVGKARGQYQLPPIDWDLVTLPAVGNEHALKNRLNAEQIAVVLPIVVAQYHRAA